jgi:tetratricopeptide (TPR) repeat protein
MFALVLFFGQFLSCYSPTMSHYRKAQRAEQNLDNATAEKEYLAAVAETPDDPVVIFALAKLYVRMEKQSEAVTYFEKFLELTKNSQSSWTKERWEANFFIEKRKQDEEAANPKKKKKNDEEEDYSF